MDSSLAFANPLTFQTWRYTSSLSTGPWSPGKWFCRASSLFRDVNYLSEPDSFEIVPVPLAIPFKFPVPSRSPRFSWYPVIGAKSYTLEISGVPDFSKPIYSQSGLLINFAIPALNLVQGREYFWRVSSDLAQGVFSEPVSVRLDSDYMPSLVPVVPIAQLNAPRLKFKQVNAEESMRYVIQVDDDLDFASPLVNERVSWGHLLWNTLDTALTLPDLGYGKYYRRISSEADFTHFTLPDSFLVVETLNLVRKGAWSIPGTPIHPFLASVIDGADVPPDARSADTELFDRLGRTLWRSIFRIGASAGDFPYPLAHGAYLYRVVFRDSVQKNIKRISGNYRPRAQ